MESPDKSLSVTPGSDAVPQPGSISGGHPTVAAPYGSGPIQTQSDRRVTVGLGLVSAALAFGVTLAGLMIFATPSAPAATASAVVPVAAVPATAAPAAAPMTAVAPAQQPTVVAPAPVVAAPQPQPAPAAATHGELALVAEPAAAQVFVDGRSMGNAPFDGVVVAGMHDIRVQAEGFVAWETKIEVVRGERQTLNVVLLVDKSSKGDKSPSRRRQPSKPKPVRNADGSPLP